MRQYLQEDGDIIARAVAGIVLIMYLAASIYGMAPADNNLIQTAVLGAILLLFGDALRSYYSERKNTRSREL